MLRKFKKDIFREPRRGLGRSAGLKSATVQVVAGCMIVALSFLGPSQSARPFFLSFEMLLGLTLVLQGVAELLPDGRRALAGGLRLGSVVLGVPAILSVVLRYMGSP